MTESSDKDSKKVHLIKQTKPTPEQPQEQAAQVSPDHGGEKKKVVVIVKKKSSPQKGPSKDSGRRHPRRAER